MTTLQQTIKNPIGRRISVTLDIPREVPLGPPLTLTYAFAPVSVEPTEEPSVFDAAARILGYKDDLDYLRANSPKTIEEAEAEAERKFKTRKSIYEYYGIIAGDAVYGDGMEYQRKMRNEWPD
jgi:hypothetical protein